MPVTIENQPLRENSATANPQSPGAGGFAVAMPGTFVREQPRPAPPSTPAPSAAPTTSRSAWASAAPTPARPTPLPKRSKGRYFVAAILLTLGGFLSLAIWNLFLRYEGYGLVEGRVITISAPWGGLVRSLDAREGENVSPGDVLLTVESPLDQAELASAEDELRMAQAELHARSAELRLAAQLRGDLKHKAQAEYYEVYGTLLQEQSRLTDLVAKRDRNEELHRRAAISQEVAETARLDEQGQRAKIEKLRSALAELERRVTLANEPLDEEDGLKPNLIRMEVVEGKISRLREKMASGRVRSPVGGRVIRRLRFTGERVDGPGPVLELLEDDSLQVVVYLPHAKAAALRPGQPLTVVTDVGNRQVTCTVERIADRLEMPPPPLVRYYNPNEILLPVYLRPVATDSALRLGGVVRLPRSWSLLGS
jgi:multidrug resistance efflux pump